MKIKTHNNKTTTKKTGKKIKEKSPGSGTI
jgi:hypothetical protein